MPEEANYNHWFEFQIKTDILSGTDTAKFVCLGHLIAAAPQLFPSNAATVPQQCRNSAATVPQQCRNSGSMSSRAM